MITANGGIRDYWLQHRHNIMSMGYNVSGDRSWSKKNRYQRREKCMDVERDSPVHCRRTVRKIVYDHFETYVRTRLAVMLRRIIPRSLRPGNTFAGGRTTVGKRARHTAVFVCTTWLAVVAVTGGRWGSVVLLP